MNITYQQLLSLPAMEGVKLYAGAEGMYRLISWTQVLEFDEIEEWVNPGSLVFVTGVAVDQWKKSLAEVVQQAIHMRAAGMVIYLGPYIKEITEEIRDLCNREKFPFFVAPREVKTYEVSYQMARVLFTNQGYLEIAGHIINDAYINQITDNTLLMMNKLSFSGTAYQCMILQLIDIEIKKDNFLTDLENMAKTLLERQEIEVISRAEYHSIVFILAYRKPTIIKNAMNIFYDRLNQQCQHLLGKMEIRIYCSSLVQEEKSLGICMKQVMMTREIAIRSHLEEKICTYKNMGVYRLLCSEDLSKEMQEYMRDYLGDLLNPGYEDLLATLNAYIQNDLSITKSAETLYIHVNTMKYRIKRIEEILGVNLRNHVVANDLYIALAIYQLNGRKFIG